MRVSPFPQQPNCAITSSQGTRRFQLVLPQQSAHKCHRFSTERGMKRRAMVQSQMTDQLPSLVASEAGSRPPHPTQDPIFYTHTLCPYAERVWLALLEKGVPFHLVHVDLSSKPSWYYSLNPSGMVPALQVEKQVHVESADIIAWIDQAFDGTSLTPQDEEGKKAMQELVRGPCSRVVATGLGFVAGRGASWSIGSGQSSRQRADLEAVLGQLASSIQHHGGPFLVGKNPSLADILIYPFMRRFEVCSSMTGYSLSEASGGAIGRWLEAMSARPSCSIASADATLLLQAFKKHRSLDFFDYTTYSCFQLHPHNAHLLQ